MCTCVRACLPVCVCVRVRAQDMIDATGASQRRHLLDCESGCVATAGIGGEGMLLRVGVRVAVRAPASNGLRLWCFRLCCRLCFAHATPSTRIAPLQGTCHRPTTTSAAGEPHTAPQASPARTLAIARAKILKSSPLLGSFLGHIFTSWRPGFSHFHKARTLAQRFGGQP